MIARRLLLAAWLVLLAASLTGAQPLVRVVVRPKPPHLPGQQVQIDVQVYVPNFFMSAPKFPTIDIPGAVVNMPDESGVNLNDSIRGESYAGLQKTYVFIAQTAGHYMLPPAAITFRYAREPGKPTDASVTLPPIAIDVAWPAGKAPPAAAGGTAALVTAVTIAQTLDRDPATVHVGDALTRTIATTAAHTQAMFIPPPRFTAPEGVRVYQKDPVLDDEVRDRVGLVAGHRTDRVVYTFDAPGVYVLPAFEVPFFDPQANREQTASAAAVSVTVSATTAPSAVIAPEAPAAPSATSAHGRRLRLALIVALAVTLLAVLWALRRVVRRGLHGVVRLCALAWAALRRDRARHLPPLNPA